MKYLHIGLFSLILLGLSITQMRAEDQYDPWNITLTVTDTMQTHGPHTLNQTTDKDDYFKFYLTFGQNYNFHAPCTLGNAIGTLYDDNLNQVAFNNNEGGFRIHFSPRETGWYSLQVTNSNSDCSYTLEYNRATKKQRFNDVQIACASSVNSWSFVTSWNIWSNTQSISPQWYNGDFEWRYSLGAGWTALFVYDSESMHTWELIWGWRQWYVK
jgi:hypothetical protein